MNAATFSISRRTKLLVALLLILGGAGWLALVGEKGVPPPSSHVEQLVSGAVASMNSPVFVYKPGWQVSGNGADTTEPEQPWAQPSGRMAFQYSGRELALQLALGDYWGYIFVTVDGRPANRLAVLRGNLNSAGQPSGYKPLFAPEKQTADGPASEWLVVHRADMEGVHDVTVEVWRGWGQTALRGVAVDGLPRDPLPQWPGILLALLGGWLAFAALGTVAEERLAQTYRAKERSAPARALPVGGLRKAVSSISSRLNASIAEQIFPWPAAIMLAIVGLLMIGAGVISQNWVLTVSGLIQLGAAGLHRPVLWSGALLFALPLYLYPLPILPGRALNLIEVGVYGGLALIGLRFIITRGPARATQRPASDARHRLLFVVVALALVAAFAAEQRAVALREWRTLFLSAALFALLLHETMSWGRSAADRSATRYILALAWLAGGAFVALSGLWQYITEQNIIQAEGVNRVRAFYGSPNNLALYLERTAAVGLGLGLGLAYFGVKARRSGQSEEQVARMASWSENTSLLPSWLYPTRLAQIALLLTLPQLIALLLTFSKGALFLGLPAMLVGLAVAGRRLLGTQSNRLPAWWGWGLAAVAVAMILGLIPFLGAERFRSLLDFRPESTGGIRLNLWRSSVQMALDHMWLGVGPDNFLYSYRSGYILPAAWRDPSLNHPHNVVLDWWTRLGLPGLAVAVAWLWLGIRSLWRAATVDALAVGALGAIAAGLGHGLIDASYALPDLLLVWVFLLHLFGSPAARKAETNG